jgi:hypothetical protein
MKKIIPFLIVFLSAAVISVSGQETKSKPVTTPADKVHNVIHPHHKVSHGKKYVHKSASGKKTEAAVKTTRTEAADPKRKVKKD